jgi:outer membrane protein assembly factor BamB
MITASAFAVIHAADATVTFESWDFSPAGEILAMTTIQDLTRDTIDDVIVAARDRTVYAIDGATGEKLWNYTGALYYNWKAVVTSPAVDANANSKFDVLVATDERLVMMLDGSKGRQLWAYNVTDSSYKQGSACSISVRSAHFVSDINRDGALDAVVVSGTGDGCAQKDVVEILALSSKTGQVLWEYSKAEDYHGLKDGNEAASPVAVRDFDGDGSLDVAFADEQSELHIIDGMTGSETRSTDLAVFGSIWDFTDMPDVTGDGIPDALAFEFVEAGGGPDYASIDAVDLAQSRVLWQVRVGDGRINGGALFSAASLNGTATSGGGLAPLVAVTMRTENELTLVLLDAKTGEQKWQYFLGEERSRNDLDKIYPVSRIATAGARDELAVGSIDSKLYLLNPLDGSIIWSHGLTGEVGGMTYVAAPGGQKYIIVEDSYLGIRALSRQTTIPTTLSIESSSQRVVTSTKIVISGVLDPVFPGELVQLRYVDPTGSTTTRSIIMSKDGTYSDTIEPEVAGTWRVSAEFAGEGFYLSSKSPTIEFVVEEEVEHLVYQLKMPDDESVSYPIAYFVDNGQVSAMTVNKEAKTLRIQIDPEASPGRLKIDLPRSVIDAFDTEFQVRVDGRHVQHEEIETDDPSKRILSIPFDQNSAEITISGTYIVPEFPAVALIVLASAMVAAVTVIGLRSRLSK